MADNLTYDRQAMRRVIRRIRRLGGDYALVGPKVGNIIARHIRKQFATKGAYFGTPWRPLSPSTLKQKRMKGFRAAPLVRSGDLKRGVTVAPMDYEVYTNTFGRYGTKYRIAKFQHFGTKRKGRRHIPPRPIIGTNPKMTKDVVEVVRRHVLGVRR